MDPLDGLVITAVDTREGTITFERCDSILQRMYSSEKVQSLIMGDTPMLAWRTPRQHPAAIGTATVATITTAAALEWLRHRKAAVAAAESSDGAFGSLLDEFTAWLTAFIARIRGSATE